MSVASLYLELRGKTFHAVHVEAARRLAARAQQNGLERFVQVSGIGADAASPSLYIRKRGEGERAVRATFADALIMRPAVMFGPGDSLLNTILALLRKIPVLPMFGRGLTRLQPVYVGDVAQAIARVLERTERRAVTFELGGPHIDSYEELLRAVAGEAGIEARLVSMPFDVWQHGWRKYPRTLP